MKIGILTYHRSHNYGALLQGIALKEVLVRLGHQVTFIDYWPAYHRHIYALFSFHWMMARKGIRAKISYLKNCIANYKNRKNRKTNFDAFIKENVEPYTSSMDDKYDVIVHGSDQIWRKQPEINTYNPVYFGKHQIKSNWKVSYAASMGILPTDEFSKNLVKEYLSCLDAISVREESLLALVKELGYPNAVHDLDPTLLLPSDYWVTRFDLKQSCERYALYYKIKDSFDTKEVRRYVESKGLKLKVIHSKANVADSEVNITTAGPQQFLQMIYGAEMVFTSSFHGLAFSLIFNKPFYASFVKNAGRAESLLKAVDLSDRLLKPKIAIPSNLRDIDFNAVNQLLQTLRKASLESLDHMINH